MDVKPREKVEYRCPYHGNAFRDYGYCVCCDGATRMIREKGEQTLTKEPSKDFRQSVENILTNYSEGHYSSEQDATNRILALCKEMLVPAEDNQGFGTATVSPSKTWNACRQHLLKQLGE